MKALKCDMCGAPLHIQKSIVKFDKNYNLTIIPIGYRCEYCGTEYSSSPYVNLEMNIDCQNKINESELVQAINSSLMTMNEARAIY